MSYKNDNKKTLYIAIYIKYVNSPFSFHASHIIREFCCTLWWGNIFRFISLENKLACHLISKGHGVDGVLSCQRDTAEEDEEEDDVGEGGGVDDSVAQLTEPAEWEQDLCFIDRA